jgi:hypothetical protein
VVGCAWHRAWALPWPVYLGALSSMDSFNRNVAGLDLADGNEGFPPDDWGVMSCPATAVWFGAAWHGVDGAGDGSQAWVSYRPMVRFSLPGLPRGTKRARPVARRKARSGQWDKINLHNWHLSLYFIEVNAILF